MNLWRIEFDEERFNDEDTHHFSFGTAYRVDFPTDEMRQAVAGVLAPYGSRFLEPVLEAVRRVMIGETE